jgi:hypothetical protein
VEEAREQLIEAKRIISLLTRACRQTQVFLSGSSLLDKVKLQRVLQEAVQKGERFLES